MTAISNVVDTIIDYKKETKRLEAEEKRVFKQAQIIHHQIDAKLEEKIAEIKADLFKFEENIKLYKMSMINIQNKKIEYIKILIKLLM